MSSLRYACMLLWPVLVFLVLCTETKKKNLTGSSLLHHRLSLGVSGFQDIGVQKIFQKNSVSLLTGGVLLCIRVNVRAFWMYQ